ncbi:MAG: hypothetical protein ACK47D_15290 [Pseudanabaena sp.]
MKKNHIPSNKIKNLIIHKGGLPSLFHFILHLQTAIAPHHPQTRSLIPSTKTAIAPHHTQNPIAFSSNKTAIAHHQLIAYFSHQTAIAPHHHKPDRLFSQIKQR